MKSEGEALRPGPSPLAAFSFREGRKPCAGMRLETGLERRLEDGGREKGACGRRAGEESPAALSRASSAPAKGPEAQARAERTGGRRAFKRARLSRPLSDGGPLEDVPALRLFEDSPDPIAKRPDPPGEPLIVFDNGLEALVHHARLNEPAHAFPSVVQ